MSSAIDPKILEALSSEETTNDWSLLLHWLRGRGEVNPQMEQILQTLINNRSSEPVEDNLLEKEDELIAEELEDIPPPSADRQKRVVGRIRKVLVRMKRELEYYRKANETLAEALGACFCWGEEPSCEVCQGRGQPGFNRPVTELYERWVLPASRRMSEKKQ